MVVIVVATHVGVALVSLGCKVRREQRFFFLLHNDIALRFYVSKYTIYFRKSYIFCPDFFCSFVEDRHCLSVLHSHVKWQNTVCSFRTVQPQRLTHGENLLRVSERTGVFVDMHRPAHADVGIAKLHPASDRRTGG